MLNFLKNKRIFISLPLIATFTSLDQLSKHYMMYIFNQKCSDLESFCTINILPIFNLTYVCNKGVSFGLLNSISHGHIFLSLVAVLISIFFIRMLVKTNDKSEIVSLILILSGAFGNLIDRVQNGCVTDFLHVYYRSYHFPVFNVADCFVTLGAIILIISEAKKFISKKRFKNMVIYFIILSSITGCSCKTKAKILQERSATISSIQKKHGDIIPPIMEESPDISECDIK